MQTLHERHLLQLDQQGGVALLPAYREIIVATLPVDKAHQLHERAATIYAQRGRYTAAIYHLSYTVEPERAIGLWRTVQQREINRGQAYPALRIFQRLAQQPLSAKVHEQVRLFCSSLKKNILVMEMPLPRVCARFSSRRRCCKSRPMNCWEQSPMTKES
ncbi:MAG: hypothetical protein KDE19_02475 [Caldilineaceae bacterium]|nr:hypothetical protein [Caldilineaceae bacterium]